jgi:hypothetical protein
VKIGFIKDAFSGMPHVMASTDGNKVEVKSITEYGKSIISDFNFDVKNISNTIPVGFVFTGFVSEKTNNDLVNTENVASQKSFTFSSSIKNSFTEKKPNITGVSINRFKNILDKANAVEFKVSAFKNATRKSEFLRRVGSGKVIFNQQLRKVYANPKFAFSEVEEDLIRGAFTEGFIRKSADKTAAVKPKNRRTARRAETLEMLSSGSKPKQKETLISRMQKAKRDVKNGR